MGLYRRFWLEFIGPMVGIRRWRPGGGGGRAVATGRRRPGGGGQAVAAGALSRFDQFAVGISAAVEGNSGAT